MIEPLTPVECLALADLLGDTPETVISVHLLRRGIATGWAIVDAGTGAPRAIVDAGTGAPRAVLVHPRHDPSEPTLFGSNPNAMWNLARSLPGWRCLNVPRPLAVDLARLMPSDLGVTVRHVDDVYHVAESPVPSVARDGVRTLTPTDEPILRAATDLNDGVWGFGSAAALLESGHTAGAIVAGRLVSVAHTGALSDAHADIGVATLPEWRGRGLATAAASLVARAVQASSLVPVWSCGAHNTASLAIARNLGFRECAHRHYLIPEPSSPPSQSSVLSSQS